jgi:site-specific recombinase XerD
VSAEPIQPDEVPPGDADSATAIVPFKPTSDTTGKRAITEPSPSEDLSPEALLAELRAVAEDTATLIRESESESTRRAHDGDWRHFVAWCERYGRCPLPAEPETVALYVGAHSKRHKAATIRRRLATVAVKHREAYPDDTPPTKHEGVRRAWRGLLRTYGAKSKPKNAARIEQVRRMVEALDVDTLAGKRDRAILLIGFAGAFRRSEVVGFDVGDVEERSEGLAIVLRSSKTNQEGEHEAVGIGFGKDPTTCPVRAWRTWLAAAEITEGPPFRPIDRHGHVGDGRLTGRSVALIVKRAAEAAGYDPTLFAGHSLRRGLISSAADAGVAEHRIMRHSRHKSIPQVRKYMEEAGLFKDNPSGKVGL